VEEEDSAADRGSRGGGCVEVLGFTTSRNSMGGLQSSRRRRRCSLEWLPRSPSPPPPPPSPSPACSGVDRGWNPEAARVESSGRRGGGLLIAVVGDGHVDGADAQEGAWPHRDGAPA
jgi:hypothetical protein